MTDFRAARLSLGLTQEQMAKAMGFKDKGTVSRIERRERGLTGTAAILLQAYLDGRLECRPEGK